MKILYDHQIFNTQKFGGISRYFIELMSRLPSGVEFDNSILFSQNVYLRESDRRFHRGTYLPQFRGRGRLTDPVNIAYSRLKLAHTNFDIFHPTYYNPYFLGKIHKPYVITVYDMIHEKFADAFAGDPTIDYKRATITNADKIIAISYHTKKDLIELYKLPESKIEVVHLGHSVDTANITPVDNLPEKYILYVGQRNTYKNWERFLRAYSIIHKSHSNVKLVCTGANFNDNEKKLIQNLGIENEIYHYFVSDSQLTYLYQHAICFVYPSLYEGFGIPILESFAAGCPLALSDTSCFPEIAQDGGLYFNPYEIDSIAETIGRIINDDSLRSELVQNGKNVLGQYSWDKMAQETAKIYQSLL